MKSEYYADHWNQAIIQALWDIFDSQRTTRKSVIHGVNLQGRTRKGTRLQTEITKKHDTKIFDIPAKSSTRDPNITTSVAEKLPDRPRGMAKNRRPPGE
jgi:hypothetical protein